MSPARLKLPKRATVRIHDQSNDDNLGIHGLPQRRWSLGLWNLDCQVAVIVYEKYNSPGG